MTTRDRVLLDTCALIWFSIGHPRMSDENAKYIQNAAEEDRLFVSVISLWELGYLQRKQKIQIEVPYKQFWDFAKARINLKSIPINDAIVVQFHALHDQLHNDPGDRFIVGTALQHKCTLVTGDKKIIDWAVKYKYPLISI